MTYIFWAPYFKTAVSSSLLKLSGLVGSLGNGLELRCAWDVSIWLITIKRGISEAPKKLLMGILTGIFQNHFLLSSLQNILFHGIFANESIDVHMRFLPNSVSSGHRLQIVLGIPITLQSAVQKQNQGKEKGTYIEDDDSISRLQINSKPTSTCRQ